VLLNGHTVYNVDEVTDLTNNYTSFITAVGNANNDGGGTYVGQALIDAYNMLVGSNSTPGAEKNIVIFTDGYIYDFDSNCTTTSDSASTLAAQMKSGLYGSGQIIKITTVKIGSGAQSTQLASLSSGPEFQYSATDFNDFADNVATQISITSCDETPDPGSGFTFYSGTPCCGDLGLSDIIIHTDSATTINLGTDGFIWGGNCYTFDSVVDTPTYSGQSVDLIFSGSITNNICTDSRCDCEQYNKYDLENCCDGNDVVTILTTGTTNLGDGIELGGNCYSYKGNPGSGTVIGTINTFITDICLSGYCTCASPHPHLLYQLPQRYQ
jgi:hypothetical protein